MNVQRDQVVVGQRLRNHGFQLGMLLLHRADELNETVRTVRHLRIVLAVGELDVVTRSLGRPLLVDCEFVEFDYEPFVLIDYVSCSHDRLIADYCWT